MRTLKRNKVKVWYRLLTGEVEIERISGVRTGEFQKTYGEPSYIMANVAPTTGNATIEPFGIDENYTHIMAVEGTDCPIDETTILWMGDSDPEYFMVVRVMKSLNHIRYAIRHADVNLESYEPPTPNEVN